ncbi:hypothetical protein BJX70DRAFT_396761 [Aspergillus crustosus]
MTPPPTGSRMTDEEFEKILQHKTPPETIEELKAACRSNDFLRFDDLFDEWKTLGYDMGELLNVMELAVQLNNATIVQVFTANDPMFFDTQCFNAIKHFSSFAVEDSYCRPRRG